MERTFRTWCLHGLCLLLLWPHTPATAEETTSHTLEENTSDTAPDTSDLNVTQVPTENYTWHRQVGEQTDGYMSDQYITNVPFPLITSTRESPCQNVDETIQAGDGTIRLTETQQDCNDMWTWTIQASSPTDGIILQFNDVYLRYRCNLRIFTLVRGSERIEQRKFTAKKSDSMFFDPLLLKESKVLVVLDAPYTSYKYSMSVVDISYFAHPIKDMPPRVFHDAVPSVSLSMYDCSRNVTIPTAFKCNMMQQCLFNEDEEGCQYSTHGCEKGWAPFKDQCFKMEFITVFSYVPGHAHATFPSVAEKTCSSRYGGTLARLPDAEAVSFVARMLRQSGHHNVVVGIKKAKPVSKRLRHLYRFLWQWGDKGSPMAYDQQQLQRDGPLLDCATLNAYPGIRFAPLRCVTPDTFPQGYVCMKPNPSRPQIRVSRSSSARFPPPSRLLDKIPTKKCSDGSLVQTFHRCLTDTSSLLSPNGFVMFHCRYGPHVHYALVCDGNNDCVDGSDEMDCSVVFDTPAMETVFVCENLQMIPKSQRCDGMPDCFDESDEVDCVSCRGSRVSQIMCTGVGCVPALYATYIEGCPTIALSTEGRLVVFKPSVVTFSGYGMSRMIAPDRDNVEGKFQCINGNYIPSFLLNNGEQDCPFGEDENIPPENIICPGFYVCQNSGHCVHPDFICDGIHHCPYKDDERYCGLPCPPDCLCEGYAYKCTGLSEPQSLWHARYVDLSGSKNVSLHSLQFMGSLQFLNLSRCGLDTVSLRNMSQLRIVDLSFNNLTNLSSLMFERLTGLRTLNLSGNPFLKVLDSSFPSFIKSSGLVSLQQLIITDTDLQSVEDMAFSALRNLITLDIQRNQIQFYDKGIFSGLGDLKVLLTDDSKLCCDFFQTALVECIAPVDELSTCSDLLRLDFFRVFLWTFSVLAIVGNAGVLLYRAFSKQQGSPPAFRVLVSNLCTADFFMGVYMMIIGIADAAFRGVYVAKESEWKDSPACQIAGFLGLVSSEVSAMVICLITLDRLLVLCFPLKNHLHLKGRSSMIVCLVMWLLGLSIAALPFLLHLDFYGETGICLPLPITRHKFSGQRYAFGVFIILNFVLFIFIGTGQIFIYCIVRNASKFAGAQRREQELAIARRLFLVVFTDFCCWFPIGLMGLLASVGIPIPGEVNVLAAIFILPVNSALNPFLYTLNAVLEKRRTAQLKQRSKRILGNMQSELPKLQPNLAEEVVRVCIRSKVVKREKMLQWLNLRQDSNMSFVGDSEFSSERTSSFILRDTKGSLKSSTISE